MTWIASHVFAQPLESVIAHFRHCEPLAHSLYRVSDLEGHEWPYPSVQHELPPGGLLVCLELCEPGSFEARWHESAATSWKGIEGSPATEVLLPDGYAPPGDETAPSSTAAPR